MGVILSSVVLLGSAECLNTNKDPLEVLELQLEQFRGLLSKGDEGGRHLAA